ncbi:prolyl 4-hydroxylase [Inhella inkyongensis]|uniref:Prolyl 4-hydroxylase n=1 Tax=Inhella inkyongensis TaxID=392593 RepID=A0A840S614_9BURK|nr:2OG-Fe(II) oxygenase [Inhella inkyongensis]MBB5203930.1 prolyl 4-hydroxylase [Inhella inkyongensis]
MTQYVTPDLRRWIKEQLAAGQSAADLVLSMTGAGWEQKVAVQAVAQAKLDGWFKKDAPKQPALPEPNIEDGRCEIDVGDRVIQVLSTVQHPRVVVFGNLLDRQECETIIEAARPRMERSETVAEAKDGSEVNAARTSRGMFFERGENEVIARVEARIARLVNWPVENGEGLQVLNYQPGAEYQPHYDYFDAKHVSTPSILKRGGQRLGTLVMYLNTPKRGGATTFPDIRMAVQPIQGQAVFFSYDKPDPSTMTLHGGAPVLEGEKWVATKWLRQGRFE